MFKYLFAYVITNTRLGIPQKTVEYKKTKNKKPENIKIKSQIAKLAITKRK